MNGAWPAVDNWLDLLGNVWIGVVVIAAAAVPAIFARRSQKLVARLDASINNGHSMEQPLRGDVDEIRATLGDIRHDLHTVKSELGDLRSELRHERQDRLELDHRFEADRRRRRQ